ncbi:helix-turn-helix transcriptional regulator [Nitrospirillum sp. BR 11828]|uniref:AraC family transcriptional regulator n=1 Tax=Nitrospirillum sp. BR 11828 TaxID=3104325 RepID=UPI002ACA519E|nr:helix-turn-helix transcriptional regulator [Nitrospirillum sp. BR 11828]MDZ5650271.1 helix-turn-helix transcriptional regulator [Nitrospirillum sp. BR 11828]
MVRNVRSQTLENLPDPVFAVGNDYPQGLILPPHRHSRCQLLYGIRGVMTVATAQGTWMVPPERAVWIPAGVVHEVEIVAGPGAMRSLYIAPAVLPPAREEDALDPRADRCQVVGISPLVHALLVEAAELPAEVPEGSRGSLIMALLLHELPSLPVLPLSMPLPTEARLAARCRAFVTDPDPHATIDGWAHELGMSRRAFTRHFRRETGLSFAAWRQQACLFAALPRLAAGEAVTTVALDLGYDSPAAFTSMFKRLLGVPPSRYLRPDTVPPPSWT